METTLTSPGEFLGRLEDDFPIYAKFDDADVYESDELLVLVNGARGGDERRFVQVILRRPIPVATVPDYLFGTDERGTSSSGLLGPLWFRRQQEEEQRRPGYRPAPQWMSVPRPRVEGSPQQVEDQLGSVPSQSSGSVSNYDDEIPF